MGGTHSRSEDLRKRAFLSSGSYIDSLQEIPGYFTRTQQTIDFLGEDLSSEPRIEMSYTGPPSHLQHSRDVHPFLDRFGPDFHPRERIVDRSHNADAPSSMLPSTESARELREIEVRETMANLKMQVKETLAKKRDQSVVQSPEDQADSALPTDEQNTLEFLDSIINESMDIDLGDDVDDNEPEKESDSEANWIMRDKSKTPLPGLMHSTVPSVPDDHTVSPRQSDSRPASGFFRNSMYLPDTDPIHSASSTTTKQPPPPTKPKPANRRSRIISAVEDLPPRDYPQDDPVSPSLPLQSNDALDIMSSKEGRTGSKNSSNASTEDMGIVVDDVASDEGSRNGDANNLYDTKSRVRGVRALVSMYSEEATSPTEKVERIDLSPNVSFVGMQLPVRDYAFSNNNNSNTEKFGGDKVDVTGKGERFGTISSEDSALGDSNRDPVEDAVLGVIHSELEKLRIK
ncbi:uncharacterized protein LOC119741521 [Patiria miniata]|uniref:Uncharacterized protein n=1 Tax=Patiria miniata TaxID=46514 RepID=A0A914BB35_PATMI|nr:uncharacterized protein LOC119741521 [Patiria miniata]